MWEQSRAGGGGAWLAGQNGKWGVRREMEGYQLNAGSWFPDTGWGPFGEMTRVRPFTSVSPPPSHLWPFSSQNPPRGVQQMSGCLCVCVIKWRGKE